MVGRSQYRPSAHRTRTVAEIAVGRKRVRGEIQPRSTQRTLQDDANIRWPVRPRGRVADLGDLIQRVALAKRHCGYRHIAQELRRQSVIVNAKRVLRLMREDNLPALRAQALRSAHDDKRPRSPDTAQPRAPASTRSGRPISVCRSGTLISTTQT
jgi:hypothetical protein